MSVLKPCPFCRVTPVVNPRNPLSEHTQCEDQSCAGHFVWDSWHDRSIPLELWNRRAQRFTPEEADAIKCAIRALLDQPRYYGPGSEQPGSKVAATLCNMLEETK